MGIKLRLKKQFFRDERIKLLLDWASHLRWTLYAWVGVSLIYNNQFLVAVQVGKCGFWFVLRERGYSSFKSQYFSGSDQEGTG